MALCEKLGKKPVAVNDAPGFVSNRVLMPLINEAAFCVMEGVATPESVDAVMKLGMNHPMGPLELADFIGLDVCVDILRRALPRLRRPQVPRLPAAAKSTSLPAGWAQIGPRLLHLRKLRLARRRIQGENKYLLFVRPFCYLRFRRFQQALMVASCWCRKTCHPERIAMLDTRRMLSVGRSEANS